MSNSGMTRGTRWLSTIEGVVFGIVLIFLVVSVGIGSSVVGDVVGTARVLGVFF